MRQMEQLLEDLKSDFLERERSSGKARLVPSGDSKTM